jgi:hypothetical protein
MPNMMSVIVSDCVMKFAAKKLYRSIKNKRGEGEEKLGIMMFTKRQKIYY